MNKFLNFSKGIVRENPVLVLALGMCPTLAVTGQVSSALGMGIAATFVLICSNSAVSFLRNAIPDKVRLPCYIVLIAGFVTLAKMAVEAYAYPLYQSLGIFLPLIAVNCIIFARAEIFAKKNGVLDSAIDAVGMGAGFTAALLMMSTIREIFGAGSWFGFELPVLRDFNIPLLTEAPGGFIVFGLLMAVVNKLSKGKTAASKGAGCVYCPGADACGKGCVR